MAAFVLVTYPSYRAWLKTKYGYATVDHEHLLIHWYEYLKEEKIKIP